MAEPRHIPVGIPMAERFRRLLEAAPDAMVIADRSGRIVLVNAQTERQFGDQADEWGGQRGEVLGRRKDAGVVPFEICLSPIEDAGEFLVTAAIRDISERKAAQEALRLSEERFRLLVNEVKDYGIFMLDLEGRVRSWNEGAREISGYQAEEIVGQHFSLFYTQDDAQRGLPARELESAGAQGRSKHEGWRVRKDGSRFWASVVTTTLHDQEGRPFGFTQVMQDTTARKQARETFLLEV